MHLPPRVFAKLDEFTLASLIISLIAYSRDRRHRTWTWSSVPPISIAGESCSLKTRARYPCIRFYLSRSVRNGKWFFVEKMMCIKTLERLMSFSSVQVVSQSACPFQVFCPDRVPLNPLSFSPLGLKTFGLFCLGCFQGRCRLPVPPLQGLFGLGK